jgi:hypothetical protein
MIFLIMGNIMQLENRLTMEGPDGDKLVMKVKASVTEGEVIVKGKVSDKKDINFKIKMTAKLTDSGVFVAMCTVKVDDIKLLEIKQKIDIDIPSETSDKERAILAEFMKPERFTSLMNMAIDKSKSSLVSASGVDSLPKTTYKGTMFGGLAATSPAPAEVPTRRNSL